MPDNTNKVTQNVDGAYYVDGACIDCDFCRDVAPDNFRLNSVDRYSYVYKQPGTVQEREECEEAREGCPVDAIGADG